MNFTQFNLKEFIPASKFPVNICTIQNQAEPNVFDSEQSFVLLVVDKNNKDRVELVLGKPYIWKDPEGTDVLYGWTDSCGNILDNEVRSIHDDWEYVTAFFPVNEEDT